MENVPPEQQRKKPLVKHVQSRYLQATTQHPLPSKEHTSAHTTPMHSNHNQQPSKSLSTSPLHDASLQELAGRVAAHGRADGIAQQDAQQKDIKARQEQGQGQEPLHDAAEALRAKLEAYRQQKLASKATPVVPCREPSARASRNSTSDSRGAQGMSVVKTAFVDRKRAPLSSGKPSTTPSMTAARPKATRVMVQQQHTPHAPAATQPRQHAPSTAAGGAAAAPSMPGVITTLAAAATRRRRPSDVHAKGPVDVHVVLQVLDDPHAHSNHGVSQPCSTHVRVVLSVSPAAARNNGGAGLSKATVPRVASGIHQRAQRRASIGASMDALTAGTQESAPAASARGMHTPAGHGQRIPAMSTATTKGAAKAVATTPAGAQSQQPVHDVALLKIQALQWRHSVVLLERRAAAQQAQADATIAAAALAVADATEHVSTLRAQVQCAAVARHAAGLLEAQAPGMHAWLEQQHQVVSAVQKMHQALETSLQSMPLINGARIHAAEQNPAKAARVLGETLTELKSTANTVQHMLGQPPGGPGVVEAAQHAQALVRSQTQLHGLLANVASCIATLEHEATHAASLVLHGRALAST